MPVKTEQLQIRITPRQKATLKSLARAAGQSVSAYVLSRALPAERELLAEILDALWAGADRRFALAELNDLLSSLPPARFPEALASADLHGLSPYVQNYVAAMVEQAAYQKKVPPPKWTRDVPPLDEPRFATDLASLRLHLLREAPVPFKRRNIFVDAGVGARV